MSAPDVVDPAWRRWLANFPEPIPAAYASPASFRSLVERAASVPMPVPGDLSPAERGPVRQYLANLVRDVLEPAAGPTLFAASISAGGGVLGLAAFLLPTTFGLSAVVVGAGLGIWGVASIGFEQAGRDGAMAVATRLRTLIAAVR